MAWLFIAVYNANFPSSIIYLLHDVLSLTGFDIAAVRNCVHIAPVEHCYSYFTVTATANQLGLECSEDIFAKLC